MRHSNKITGALLGLVFQFVGIRAHELTKRQAINVQNPPAFQALDILRGRNPPTAAEVQGLMASAVPGNSYPTLAYIPQTSFTCGNARQPGFYADPETRCQVFHRCEHGYMYSFICPNTTIFNQIVLTCDHWYNVQCENNAQFADYSNPRIYIQGARLLDDNGNGNGNGNGGFSGNFQSGNLQSGNYAGGQQIGFQQPQLQQQQQQQFQLQQQLQPQSPSLYSAGGGLQQQGGRQTSSLYGPSAGGQSSQLYQNNNQAQQGGYGSSGGSGGYQAAYSNMMSGSFPATQLQLPYGTMPLRDGSADNYQSSGQLQFGLGSQLQQQQFNPPDSFPSQPQQQFQLPFASQLQQSAIPSYRSLTNRLLRIQADASERVNDMVTTQVPAPNASVETQTVVTPSVLVQDQGVTV